MWQFFFCSSFHSVFCCEIKIARGYEKKKREMNYIPIVLFISCLCVPFHWTRIQILKHFDRADLQLSLLTEILELLCICNWSDVLNFIVVVATFFLLILYLNQGVSFPPLNTHSCVWWFFLFYENITDCVIPLHFFSSVLGHFNTSRITQV